MPLDISKLVYTLDVWVHLCLQPQRGRGSESGSVEEESGGAGSEDEGIIASKQKREKAGRRGRKDQESEEEEEVRGWSLGQLSWVNVSTMHK